MKWLTLMVLGLFAQSALAAPECNIDPSYNDSTSLLAVVSGDVKGFEPGPVYVTVTNGDKKYTTVVNREGKWALMYPSATADTQVLCWQGWIRNRREVLGHFKN